MISAQEAEEGYGGSITEMGQDGVFEKTMLGIEKRCRERDKVLKERKLDEQFYKNEAIQEERKDQGQFMRDMS